MQKPINKAARDAFHRGEATFNTLSKKKLDQCRAQFEKAVELEPNYARALAELSYANVHTATAGWHSATESTQALAKAEAYGKLAVHLDPDDYDTHWSLGFYYINSGKPGDFAKGIKEFETALALFEKTTDRIDRKPGLLAEMGEALVFDGRPKDGLKLLDRAINLVPDWYRWNYAFALYCDKQYKQAVRALDAMYRKPGHPRYLYDCWLTRAAAYAQLGKKKKAKDAVAQFLKTKMAKRGIGWTIEDELKRTPFRNNKAGRALRDHWIEGLRKAGLPSKSAAKSSAAKTRVAKSGAAKAGPTKRAAAKKSGAAKGSAAKGGPAKRTAAKRKPSRPKPAKRRAAAKKPA